MAYTTGPPINPSSPYTTFNEFSENFISPDLPSIFLMGARQGGKTSIERVVFHKMEAHQTLYSLVATSEIYHRIISHNELIKFQILDFPGSFDFNDSEFKPKDFFKYCSVLLFVIDAQDRPYTEALNYISKTIELSYSINKSIKYEILINKIDAEAFFTSESKLTIRRIIEQHITERLDNIGLLNESPFQDGNISYYLTSIYDHSIFEALSEIIQKLLPISVHQFLKNILTSFVTKCDIEKAFIFDIVSKIYIATDANLMETDTISLCSDMIDLTVDVSGIYGSHKEEKEDEKKDNYNNNNDQQISMYQPPNPNQNLIDANNSFDSESSSFITLQTQNPKQTILALRQVGKNLALVCIMKQPKNKGLLEYNIKCFKNAMNQLFQLLQKTKKK